MRHLVQLSNKATLVLIEENNSLSIGLADEDGEVDLYIAQITPDGVLGYATASYAPENLVNGLRK